MAALCRDLVAVAEQFSLLSPSRHWLHYFYCVAIKWLFFFSTRSVLDSDSLNKLNWRQSKGRNKRSWTVRRERKFINCIGQDKCQIPTCINYTLKHNPLTRTTKPYGFSWQTKSYTPCCVFIAKPLPIIACIERILAILQQRITALVEGSLQHHSSRWIQDVGYFCIICANCWCESLYLFTLMLLVVGPEVMVNFYGYSHAEEASADTCICACAQHARVHACIKEVFFSQLGSLPSLHLSRTTYIQQ